MNDWLPLVLLLVGVLIAFKLLKGVIKLGVILLLLGFAAYWLIGVVG